MANEPNPTQGEPEGKTVIIPGDEPAPEQEVETETAEAEAEEPAEPEAEEADAESEKPKVSWETRRRQEETNKRRQAEKEAADLRAELARLKGGGKPAEETTDINEIRRQERERIRQEVHEQTAVEQFNAACNRTFEEGSKEFPDFIDARNTLVETLGDELRSKPAFLEAITELPNGHKVFYELGKNPEEAERILQLSPIKMAIEIAKLSEKSAKPAPPKSVSKAPPPVKPSAGAVETGVRLDDESTPMDVWAKTFLKDVAKRA